MKFYLHKIHNYRNMNARLNIIENTAKYAILLIHNYYYKKIFITLNF